MLQINFQQQVDTRAAPKVQFIGAFDTVKAVKDQDRHNISLNGSIRHMRHALALHEDRENFRPEFLEPDPETLRNLKRLGRSFVQAWFVGAHIDIGGSADAAGLSLYPLQWMLIECRNLGLGLKFHGNAKFAPRIDNPLDLVFPSDEAHGKGADMWSCITRNGVRMEMQDLRKVHTLPTYSSRYSVKINRATQFWWKRKIRDPFKGSDLTGYCQSGNVTSFSAQTCRY